MSEFTTLRKFAVRGEGKDRIGRYVAVDWRGALYDALLSVDVDSSRIVDDFERNVFDPVYEEGSGQR